MINVCFQVQARKSQLQTELSPDEFIVCDNILTVWEFCCGKQTIMRLCHFIVNTTVSDQNVPKKTQDRDL